LPARMACCSARANATRPAEGRESLNFTPPASRPCAGDHDRNIRGRQAHLIGSILSDGRQLPARQRGVQTPKSRDSQTFGPPCALLTGGHCEYRRPSRRRLSALAGRKGCRRNRSNSARSSLRSGRRRVRVRRAPNPALRASSRRRSCALPAAARRPVCAPRRRTAAAGDRLAGGAAPATAFACGRVDVEAELRCVADGRQGAAIPHGRDFEAAVSKFTLLHGGPPPFRTCSLTGCRQGGIAPSAPPI